LLYAGVIDSVERWQEARTTRRCGAGTWKHLSAIALTSSSGRVEAPVITYGSVLSY
jgi:hypothetical protein